MTEYEFDCLQKKRTAQSARHRVGRSREVRLPSDGMSAARMAQYNGPCFTYRLGAPMGIDQYEELPGDLQRLYFRKLRNQGASDEAVRRMLGVSGQKLRQLRTEAHVTFDRPDGRTWAAFLQQ